MSDLKKLKKLREETDVSYSMCKDALDEAKGDIEKAKIILRKKGASLVEKKAERKTLQGGIFSYTHHNGKVGALVQLLCETDFVAINEDFKKLGYDIAMHIASTDPSDLKKLLSSFFIKDQNITVDQLIKDHILKLGENISVGKFSRFEI